MESIYVIWVIGFIINGFGVLLHLIGILAIIMSKSRSNQTIILLNLSIVDIMLLWWLLSTKIYQYITFTSNVYKDQKKILDVMWIKLPIVYEELKGATYYLLGSQLIFVMTVITTDRLIAIRKTFFYKHRVTRSIIWKLLVAGWLYSTVVGIIRGVFPKAQSILYGFLSCLWIVYLLLAINTYVIIFLRIRASRLRFVSGRSTERISWKFYLVSGLIVMSCFFFYLIPGVMMTMIKASEHLTREKLLIHEGLVMVTGVGLVSDALIYVILQKDFRNIVLGWVYHGKESSVRPVSFTRRVSRNLPGLDINVRTIYKTKISDQRTMDQ